MAKGNFIEYVISDDPNKYPNGSEQDGYYYRKVIKFETEEQTVTAGTTPIEVIPSAGKLISKVNINPTPTEEKTVIPTTEDLIVVPVEGKQLSQVTVQGDANFIEENIAEGVTMWGKTGTHQGSGSGQYVWSKQFAGGTAVEDTTGGTYTLTTADSSKPSSEIEYSASAPIYNSTTKKWEMSGSTVVTLTNSDNTVPSFSGNMYVRLTSAPNVWYLATAVNVGGSGPYTKSLAYNAMYTADIDSSYIEYVTGETEADYPDGRWVDGVYYKLFKASLIFGGDLSFVKSNITNVSFYISSIIYAKNIWVAGGNTNGLYYSIDGKNWTQSNITSDFINFIHYDNGKFLAFGDADFYYSVDGMSWSSSNFHKPVSTSGSIASDSSIFVLGCINGYGIYYSTDGITWTAGSYDTGASTTNFYHVYRGTVNYTGIFVACTNKGLYYSSDGKSWSVGNVTESFKYVTKNGIWVACGSNNNGLYYSDDAINWTRSNITNISFNYAYKSNEIWVACSNANGLYYSTDGKTWTTSNLTSGKFNHVVRSNYSGGMWIAAGSNGLYYSTDGKTWTQSNSVSEINFTSVKYYNNTWVAGSTNNGIYYSVEKDVKIELKNY